MGKKKEIDYGFFLTWNGTYSYTDKLLVFSLSEQGYLSDYFSGNNKTYIKNYGLMYGPIIDNHRITEPMQALISGFISGDVSGMIYDEISGIATGIVSASINKTVKGLLNGTFTNFINTNLYGSATGIASGPVSGWAFDENSALGKGIAKDTKISGMATGNVHTLLLNSVVTGIGFAENVLATTNPTSFPISDEYKPFLTLPAGFTVNMEMIQNISEEAEEEHSRIWTAFRSAAGK